MRKEGGMSKLRNEGVGYFHCSCLYLTQCANAAETSTVQDPSIESLMESVPFLGRNHDKTKPKPNERLQDERSHAPPTNIAPLPGDNVVHPKLDCAEKEEAQIGGEVSPIDAFRDANADDKYLKKIEPNERLTILADSEENVKTEKSDIVEIITLQDPSTDSSVESVPLLGANHDKPKLEPNEIVQDERSHAPLSNIAPVPGKNVVYPKPDSAEKEEVEICGEGSSIDAIGDANTETSTVQDPSADPLMENIPLLGTNRDKTKPKPNEMLQDERAHSPLTNIAPLPGDSVAYAKPDSTEKEVEIGGEVSSPDAITNENTDSAEKEVEIGGQVSSTDAITNENTDSTEKEVEIGEANSTDAITDESTDDKYLENIEPDERLTIQADNKENVKTEKSDTAAIETGLPPSSSNVIVNVDEDTQTSLPSESRDDRKIEILKSIVYGGLIESITSLSVVTSAISADAATLNIVALALANLVGGLVMIAHHLRELRNEQSGGTSDQTNEGVDRYVESLGRRQNFIVHATVAVLSFIIFGLVPPVVYGFSFLKSDNKDYKLAAVAAASLLCITMLAIAKSYVRKPPKNYIKTVMYYAAAGFLASGVSYIAGEIIRKLIEKFGWFNSRVAITSIADASSGQPEWVSY
ncbi:hypothetical protein JCGZ_17516 [Jatropha curcas]|uniref:Membrane protein of ER body-like protein n=1 Tax=Jatropha curcas TaxID=180498 RepID=A0A067JU84_JATCU|nr:hypothetical protein JCGZ_17516 [Jatropha curcas]